MKKYSIRNKETGLITNSWTDDKLPSDYYEPSFGPIGSFDIIVEDLSSKIQLQKEQEEARELLISTDWYAVRLIETGKPIPEEIKEARTQARLKL